MIKSGSPAFTTHLHSLDTYWFEVCFLLNTFRHKIWDTKMTTIGSNNNYITAPSRLQSMQDRLSVADIDQSGSVSTDEFINSAEGTRAPSMLEKVFNRMDSYGNGEVTEQEQQAMLDEMSERMSSRASGPATENSSVESFMAILESMSNSETDTQRSSSLQEMRETTKNDGLDRQSIAKSMATLNNMYPRIDTKA